MIRQRCQVVLVEKGIVVRSLCLVRPFRHSSPPSRLAGRCWHIWPYRIPQTGISFAGDAPQSQNDSRRICRTRELASLKGWAKRSRPVAGQKRLGSIVSRTSSADQRRAYCHRTDPHTRYCGSHVSAAPIPSMKSAHSLSPPMV